MIYKTLGSTDIQVPLLGLGTVKIGRNQGVKYPESFQLPDDQHVINLLNTAQELGINLIDTAPAYGNSQTRLGQLLPGSREDWVIVSKTGEDFINGESHFHYGYQQTLESVENSLTQLKTDYLDAILVHSNGNDISIIQDTPVLKALEKLKSEGKIRAYGMSTKTVEGGLLAASLCDIVMVTYNPTALEEKPVIDKAYELNKGVLIKKAFASGHLNKISQDSPIQKAFECIFSHPGVHSVITGTINPKHLKENVRQVEALRLDERVDT